MKDLLLLVFLCAGLALPSAVNAGDPFECSSVMYQTSAVRNDYWRFSGVTQVEDVMDFTLLHTYDDLGSMSLLNEGNESPDNLNGIGFNIHDRYMYGVANQDDGHAQVVKISRDGSAELIGFVYDQDNAEYLDKVYPAGDVDDNQQLFTGGGTTWWRIDLTDYDAQHNRFRAYQFETTVHLDMWDFAFHPTDGLFYGVVTNSNQYAVLDLRSEAAVKPVSLVNFVFAGNEVDWPTPDGQMLGGVGGIAFDPAGTLYVFANGQAWLGVVAAMFKLDLEDHVMNFLQVGAHGLSKNDAGMCADPHPEDPMVDFGDAPSYFRNTLDENGPRHMVLDGLRIGAGVSMEYDGQPDSQANADTFDDGFANGNTIDVSFTCTDYAEIIIPVTNNLDRNAYLVGYIDFDGNGNFVGRERAESVVIANSGSVSVSLRWSCKESMTEPPQEDLGSTFLRLRITTDPDTRDNGACTNGEVEDYEIAINILPPPPPPPPTPPPPPPPTPPPPPPPTPPPPPPPTPPPPPPTPPPPPPPPCKTIVYGVQDDIVYRCVDNLCYAFDGTGAVQWVHDGSVSSSGLTDITTTNAPGFTQDGDDLTYSEGELTMMWPGQCECVNCIP